MPVSFPPSTSLRLKTSSSASPFPRYFWYDLHGATSGFLIVRPALCVVPLQNLCRVASWTRVTPFHALLATWLNRQLPWWVSHPQERRPSWHTVDLVVLGLAAVDGFHVQSMAEHEVDPFPAAQIGDPVPGEDALHGHHEIFPVWGDRSQQSIGICPVVPVQENLACLVHDAEEHRSCVQVDAAVELMLMRVESH